MGRVIEVDFKRVPAHQETPFYVVEFPATGHQVRAVDEQGAASKLRMSLGVFRALRPVQPIDGLDPDEPLYAVEAVLDQMRLRGIDLDASQS